MEDFTTIIWIVLVGAGLLFSGISKAAQKAKGAAPKSPHEAWPPIFGLPLPDDQEAETSAQSTHAEETEVQQAPEYIFEDGTNAEPAYADESRYASQQQELQGKSATTLMTAKNRMKTTEPDRAEVIAEKVSATETQETGFAVENFDLAQAVVYSEILKPKFDE